MLLLRLLARSLHALVSELVDFQSVLAEVIYDLVTIRSRGRIIFIYHTKGRGRILNDLFIFVDTIESRVELLGCLALLLDAFVDFLGRSLLHFVRLKDALVAQD